MSAERGATERLFLAALARPEAEREAFVRSQAQGDPARAREVLSLLAHHAASASFLAEPALAESAQAPAPPARIGRYEIVRVLGAGGMGVVYLARQDNPRREVALKVVRPGFATPHAIRRFEHEAALLGRLHHQGVCQIFEAGTADSGAGPQPFFAMERIEGPTLFEFAARQGLGTRERLALVADVCDAVEHAHQRGVVHRDLKPSNVLVDESSGAPQVKVLDFGVARATDGDLTSASLATQPGQIVGTLAYMSPEQASGDPLAVDARSDVYALGVLAYELVSGRRPIDVEDTPMLEAARRIREDDPTPVTRVAPSLDRDVDTILAKALEKDPDRRYGSAAALAEDLRRFLAHEPISARPPSRVYLATKFARRNRALVAGVLAVLATLALGLAGTAWKAVQAAEGERRARAEGARADQEARRAKAVASFQREMLSRVQPELDGRDVKLASVLDAAAAALPGDLAGDPAAEGGVRAMLGQSYHALGLLEEAEREFDLAWKLLARSLGDEHDESVQALAWLATVVADRGRDAEALTLTEKAYATMSASRGRDDPEALVLELNLAQSYFFAGRAQEAERMARENVERRERVLGERDVRVAAAYGILGQLVAAQGRLDEAEPWLRRAYELARAVEGDRHPNTLTCGAELAALLRRTGKLDESETLYRAAIATGRDLLGEEHFEVLACEHNLAGLLEQEGELDEAESLFRRVIEVQVRVLGAHHENTLIAVENLAGLLFRSRRFADAEPVLTSAWQSLRAERGDGDEAVRRFAQRLHALYAAWGRPEDAARFASGE